MDLIQLRLPVTSEYRHFWAFSVILFCHFLILSHFEYCNLLLTDISSALLLSLEKQLNWALETVFYRSRNKFSTSLRISQEILSMKQRIDLKSFDLLFSILKNERSAFQNHLKLPTRNFRIIERNE